MSSLALTDMTRSGHARLAAVYALPDAVVVVANHHTQAGFWLAGQPVTRLHSTATDAELGAAVRAAFRASRADRAVRGISVVRHGRVYRFSGRQ